MAVTIQTPWFLSCTISPGILSDEVVASATTASGKGFSLFVPSVYVYFTTGDNRELKKGIDYTSIIGEAQTKAFLTVNVLDMNSDLAMVSLPTQPLESSQTVTVRRDQLRAAA